jgi:hypothetical protein
MFIPSKVGSTPMNGSGRRRTSDELGRPRPARQWGSWRGSSGFWPDTSGRSLGTTCLIAPAMDGEAPAWPASDLCREVVEPWRDPGTPAARL